MVLAGLDGHSQVAKALISTAMNCTLYVYIMTALN